MFFKVYDFLDNVSNYDTVPILKRLKHYYNIKT